jgi:hypothetical protein
MARDTFNPFLNTFYRYFLLFSLPFHDYEGSVLLRASANSSPFQKRLYRFDYTQIRRISRPEKFQNSKKIIAFLLRAIHIKWNAIFLHENIRPTLFIFIRKRQKLLIKNQLIIANLVNSFLLCASFAFPTRFISYPNLAKMFSLEEIAIY